MNFGQIKDSVRRYAETFYSASKMSLDKQKFLDSGLLEQFINEGYQHMVSLSRINKNEANVLTVANQAVYALPTGMFDIINVLYLEGIDLWRLKKLRYDERLWANEMTNISPVVYDTNFGARTFQLYTAPLYDNSIVKFFGVFTATDMTADADIPIIPPNYHQSLVDYGNYKVQELITIMTDDGSKSQISDKKSADFLASFHALAERLRKDNEFTGDDDFQLRTEEESTDLEGRFNYPTFNHNPILSILYFLNIVTFINTATGLERLRVDDSGLWINGSQLAMVGARGKANFTGYTGFTLVTIADQLITNYDVLITPISMGAPTGNIGEYTYEIVDSKHFKVYNTGDSTGQFSYFVTKS